MIGLNGKESMCFGKLLRKAKELRHRERDFTQNVIPLRKHISKFQFHRSEKKENRNKKEEECISKQREEVLLFSFELL